MNIISIAGKIAEISKRQETANGIVYLDLVVEVKRPFKNKKGVYEKDQIPFRLWKSQVELAECQEIGKHVSIRGRVQTHVVEKNGRTFYNPEFIAELIEFENEVVV